MKRTIKKLHKENINLKKDIETKVNISIPTWIDYKEGLFLQGMEFHELDNLLSALDNDNKYLKRILKTL